MKFLFPALFWMCLSIQTKSQNLPPFQFAQMAFYLKVSNGTGTAFLVSYKGKQYYVTARHMFDNPINKQNITVKIFKDSVWNSVNGILFVSDTIKIDVAVIQIDSSLYSKRAVEISNPPVILLGDNGYFFGFPMGYYSSDISNANTGFPFPLMKGVILSGIFNQKGISRLFLDGHNNKGFSGGPVIFIDRYSPQKNKWFIAGVISGYYIEKIPQKDRTELIGNSGIIDVISISHVIKIIERNN